MINIEISYLRATFYDFWLSHLKPLWIAFWPSFLAVLIALIIDRMRAPKIKIYPEKGNLINEYKPPHRQAGRWAFVRFSIYNRKMPCFLRWLPRQVAQNCSATIEFLDFTKKSLFVMHGRWANTPEIVHINPNTLFERVLHPDPVDISPGNQEILDCVVQKESEMEAYAWNNEAYLNNWRTPKYRLPAGKYQVKIKVNTQNGISFNETFGLNISEDFKSTELIQSKFKRKGWIMHIKDIMFFIVGIGLLGWIFSSALLQRNFPWWSGFGLSLLWTLIFVFSRRYLENKKRFLSWPFVQTVLTSLLVGLLVTAFSLIIGL